jgi:peptidyl-prolyl cis-trans isomerase B (cyclophilin B)
VRLDICIKDSLLKIKKGQALHFFVLFVKFCSFAPLCIVGNQQYSLEAYLDGLILFLYIKPKIMQKAIINSNKGQMTVEFYSEDAPNTVANFIKLIKEGYYDGLTFHRVIPNFVVQGGCPDGTGAGGPGYTIDCELNGDNQHHEKGVLSMAHAGRNTGGSQFFICHNRDNTAHLDRNHTCFGKVVEGLDVIDDIRQGDQIISISIEE